MNNITNNQQPVGAPEETEIDLKQVIEQYAYYWKWFVLSFILVLALAIAYLWYATPQYKVDAKILLENEDKASGDLAGLAELSSLTGGSGASSFVIDQLDVLKSRRIIRKVVENNDLTVVYTLKEGLKKEEVLIEDSPIRLAIVGENSIRDVQKLSIEINANKLKITNEKTGETFENISFGQQIRTKAGVFIFTPNPSIIQSGIDNVLITVYPIDAVIDGLQKDLQVTPNSEKQSYIVNFSITHALREKAGLIINSLIDTYNHDMSTDKTKVTKATSEFINSRLELIGSDLAIADKKVENYKTSNQLTDVVAETEMNLQNLSQIEKQVLDARTQLQLVNFMRESVNKNNGTELLPSNLGFQDLSIEKSLTEYNRLVLEREDLLHSSTADNPMVKNLTQSLQDFNKNLISSLNNYRSTLQLSLNNVQGRKGEIQSRISSSPRQELGFRDISRQQQIVESIYLFLLQKREENEIKASARPDILKVIDVAYGSDTPVAPKKAIILLAAIIIGLLVPFAVLYVKFLLDNKIHSRKDIESKFSAPILGEIPTSEEPAIQENDRSSLAEAFRILRTNISFMLGIKKDSAVIFITSTTSGEGKSFVSTNLARILAMSGKNVLLIGADIRSPKVLDYLGLSHLQHTNIGVTQYLINPDMDIDNIIIKKPAQYKFDVIYSGYVAPNPAELLMNGHFDDVIKYGRAHYDYVLVDTAPVSLVTDTLLIADSADLTVYVARANYLDKRLLNVPKELYEGGKLKNMAVVVNDVDFTRGYGYGYGYGYGDVENDSFTKRMLKKVKSVFRK